MLRADGGFNALGELYFGAKTVHTENVTSSTPTTTLHTVNGADNPTQLPATTWAPLSGDGMRTVSASGAQIWIIEFTLLASIFGWLLVVW